MTPYTYYLFHLPTGKHYYGVRYANDCHPNDLWVRYFTSSKYVKKLIEEYGKDSFQVEIRCVFETADAAIAWEGKVLRRLRVIYREDWLNKKANNAISPEALYRAGMMNIGRRARDETKQKMSAAKKGRKQSPEHILKRMASRAGYRHSEETRARIRQASLR